MKLYLIVMMVAFLSGCTASYTDQTESFKLPDELKDYKVVRLEDDSVRVLYVLIRKTNENRNVIGTTSPQGKTMTHTVVIDGETYIQEK